MSQKRHRITNTAEVREQILKKFGTIEEFSLKTGVDYILCINGIVQNLKPDPEFLDACRINGIYVEVTNG